MKRYTSLLSPVFTFTVLVVLSWLLVHLLTLFGVFLAIAYPIWWIIAPKQTVCFICRSKKTGARCPFCRETVQKTESTSPKTLVSAIYNGLIILVFSLISLGIVLVESQFLFQLGFPTPTKTAYFSVPSQQVHELGDIFPMQIKINSIKQAINAARFDFSYSPTEIEVVDISTKDSFATIFIQKQIDNKAGFVRFAGGLPNPGFLKNEGLFATVYLRGIKPGITTIQFLSTSSVLTNNGHGDNILNKLGSASYLISANTESDDASSNTKGPNIDTNTLGASTTATETQMVFYNEQEVKTNGTKTIDVPQENATRNALLTSIGILDSYILTLWRTLFSR